MQGIKRLLSGLRGKIIFILLLISFLFVSITFFYKNVHADTISNSYTPAVGDNTVPRGGSKLYYVTISGAPNNAVITNVETKFDYIAYNGVQSYLSCRFNKGSDPGASGGVVLVNQGSLPAGNPGTYGYIAFSNWNGQSVNANYYFRFAMANVGLYDPTINTIYVRVTYVTPPAAPSLNSPNDYSVRYNQTPHSFDWNDVSGATNYRIYVDNNNGFGSPEISSEPTVSQLSSYTSLPNNVYYWQVQAYNSAGWGSWSMARQFVVDTPPPSPTLSSPANGNTYDQGSSVTFSWSGPTGYSINRYYIRIVQGTDLNATPKYDRELTATTEPVNLSGWGPGTYTWAVRAIKNAPSGYNQSNYETAIGWGQYATRTFSVNALPDLTSSAIVNSNYAAGQSVQIPVTVYKSGGSLTAGTFVDARLYWSINSTWAGDQQLWAANQTTPDFPNSVLNSSGSKTVNATITIPTGVTSGYIIVYADPPFTWYPNGYHSETNEGNNTAAYLVTVYAVNPQVSVSPSSGPQGTTFSEPGTGFTRNSTATLYFSGPDGPSTVPNKATDGNGDYTHSWLCDACPAGQYSYYAIDNATGKQSNTIYFTVTTQNGGSISGVVIDSIFTTPINGATIQLKQNNVLKYTDTSDPTTGNYSIPNIVPGTYDLVGTKSGYQAWTQTKTINAGQNLTGQNIAMVPQSISGNVTFNGTALSNVNINLTGTISDNKASAPDGGYTFFWLPDGSYTVTPSLSGYSFNPPYRNVTLSNSSSYGQDFRACNTSVPLLGIVRDATKNYSPLSGISIYVDRNPSATTNSSGYYAISGLSCGLHTITANVPPGYYSYSSSVDTSLTTTLNINLTAESTSNGLNNNSGKGADPVNTATGNYIYYKKDFEMPGIGMPFVFERNYNSRDASGTGASDMPLGYGWHHTHDVILSVDPVDSSVTIRWGDGKTETWTPDGVGGYTPQYGVFDTLIDNGGGLFTLKKKDLTNYNFNSSNRLATIIDKNGNTISLTYSGGNLTQITDTAGRNIDFTYDGNNRITVITGPIGRTLQYSYGLNGDLVTATDMNGNVTNYTYDVDHQMLTVVDPRGNTVVTNVYDSLNRVVNSQSDAKGGVTAYTYDAANHKTTFIDQEGYTTIHYHDDLLRLIQETDGLGNSAYYHYDAAGNRDIVTDKNGHVKTYTYDSEGNVLTKSEDLDAVTTYTTTITYDTNNNPLTRTDALGNVTTFEYDATGNLTKTIDPLGRFITITYTAKGQPLTITDARGGVTTNTYDAEGNVIEITDALWNKTIYTYDGVGRRLTVKDALNRVTTYTYDNNNNLLTVTDPMGNVTTYTYDGNNNKLTVTDPNGNTMTFTYDVKDLLETITDPLLNAVTTTYDGLDRKKTVTDKRGNITTYDYDAVGNVLNITDPMSKVTSFTYDKNGNKKTETNPLTQTTTYTYDALNRLVSVTDNLGNVTTTSYDALGRVISTTNAKGQTTDFNYDALGRLLQVTDATGGTVTYTYDENGNRLTMTEPKGNTTSYTYDALNRLIQKVEPLGNTYQYTYDAVSNRISLTDAKGNTINYTYDANNRLSVITYPDTSTVTFSYDANGNRIQMVDNLGTSTYSYDVLNRMVSHADPFGKTIGYGYDANGNRTLLTYPGSKAVNYSYDVLNRLSSVTDWLPNTTSYAYDAAGKLMTATNPNGTTANYSYDTAGRLTGLSNEQADTTVISSYTYTLDALGNHTSAVNDEPLLPILTNKNITYAYDAESRLINEGGTAQFYDANGNLTAKGNDNFIYDYEDRLTQSNIGGVITQYGYNGFGNRLSKTQGSATTKYVLDINRKLANVIAETDNTGTITAYYVYGLGLISKVMPDGTAYYYHYDSRGSTIALSDASANLTDTYAYGTFGNFANSQGTTGNPFKYVGRYGVMDEGNGLNYIRARYYSPEAGRFITKDPQTGSNRDGQSLNRYIYALNNPVRLIDISGFSPKEGTKVQDLSQSSDVRNNYLIGDIDTKIAGSTPMIKEQEYDFVYVVTEEVTSGMTWYKAAIEAAVTKLAPNLMQSTFAKVGGVIVGILWPTPTSNSTLSISEQIKSGQLGPPDPNITINTKAFNLIPTEEIDMSIYGTTPSYIGP